MYGVVTEWEQHRFHGVVTEWEQHRFHGVVTEWEQHRILRSAVIVKMQQKCVPKGRDLKTIWQISPRFLDFRRRRGSIIPRFIPFCIRLVPNLRSEGTTMA